MDNYKINIGGAFGSSDNDIKKIYLLSADSGKIDSVYVEYNDGLIEVEDKPEELDYNDFAVAVKDFMKSAGATGENKYSKWFPTRRVNSLGIDFDELDTRYNDQHQVVEDEDLDFGIEDELNNEEELANEEELVNEEENVVPAAVVLPAATVVEEKVNEKTKDNFGKGIVTGLAIALGATALGVGGYELYKTLSDKEAVQTTDTTKEIVELPGAQKEEQVMVSDAAEVQEAYFNQFEESITDFNTYAKKFYTHLTEDDFKNAKEAGITLDETKDYANEGFDAEEVYAALLRWGSEKDNKELAKINAGEEINIEKVMSSSKSDSNRFEEDLIMMLLLDDELDELPNKMEKLFGDEAKEFNQFFSMYKEFKTLKNDGKIDEAHNKMNEIKEAYSEYAFGDNSENDRIFGLTVATWGTVFSTESQICQFRDNVTYTFFDTNTGKEVEKTFKTNTWDEVLSRSSILGFKNCSEVSVNGETKYAATIEGVASNFVYIIDEPSSIVDLSLSNEESMLKGYNSYITAAKTENANIDGSYVGAGGDVNSEFMNSNSEYDQLTQGTISVDALLETVNTKLEDANINGVNKGYYNMLIAQKAMEFKDKYTKVNKNTYANLQKGDTVVIDSFVQQPVTPEQLSAPGAVVVDENGNPSTPEAEMEKARKKWKEKYQEEHPDEHVVDSEEEAEEEAQEEQEDLQAVYNGSYNYFLKSKAPNYYDQYCIPGAPEYKSEWATSSDANVKLRVSQAEEDVNALIAALKEAEQFNNEQEQQQTPNSDTPSEPPTDGPNEGITSEDPTNTDGFAPVVDENTQSEETQTEEETQPQEEAPTEEVNQTQEETQPQEEAQAEEETQTQEETPAEEETQENTTLTEDQISDILDQMLNDLENTDTVEEENVVTK